MTDYPEVRLRALDKSTARTTTLRAKVGTTIEYGSLFIKTQACRKSDPLSKPEDAAFVQVWEVPLGKEKSEWIFSGWMFSSSPAVSAMDHAVYDIWVIDCFDPDKKQAALANKIIVTTDDGEEIIDDLEELSNPVRDNDVRADQEDLEGATDVIEEEVDDSEQRIEAQPLREESEIESLELIDSEGEIQENSAENIQNLE